MYHLSPEWSEQAAELARLWQEYSLSYSRNYEVLQKIKPKFEHHDLQLSRLT